MPLYDNRCLECGTIFESFSRVGEHPVCACGGASERVWIGKAATVIDDSIPGGMVIENLGARPQTFYSKSDYKRAMDAAGVKPYVRHIGEQGSDKSKHTTRWI